MRSLGQTNRNRLLLPTSAAPRYAGHKRRHALTLAFYDPAAAAAAAEKRDNEADAGALVPFVAAPPVVDAGPINAIPLAAAVAAPDRAEPWWLRTHLFPHLRLRSDLPAHFIDDKAVTATDLDPHQNRFRLPNEGVFRSLRPLLSAEELEAASLLHEEPHRQRQPPPTEAELQGRKKRKGKRHGGLPVLVVDTSAGIRELQLSRWEGSRGTIIKGEGYLDFIKRCSFKVNDDVEIWAFKERRFRYFGVTMCDESPLYVLITKKGQHAKV